ncbi:MAG: hypothetical protein ACK5SX_06705 [Sandaracinobacter sp.]
MRLLLQRIRDGLSRGAYPNERAVSTSIVVPILRELGWDDSDPTIVKPEYATGKGRVDYALAPRAGSPAVFVEVKGVGKSGEADRQLFEYAFHEGAQIAVLTDGRIWSFYLPGQFGTYDERRVFQLDLLERDEAEAELRFTRYLARIRIQSGSALSDASADYHDQAARRRAAEKLPQAWMDMLRGPDADLVSLLQDNVEGLSGHRPSDEAVARFLSSQSQGSVMLPKAGSSSSRHNSPAPVSVPTSSAVESLIDAQTPAADGKALGWRLGTQSGTGKNQVTVWVAFLSELFRQHPAKQKIMASAVKTRGRNNIARTIADIYPNQPEIAARYNALLPDGWVVGTNESSATKMRIAMKAADACGLVWGQVT